MKLVVGLGNTGIRYKKTRHNLGFILLNEYAKEHNLSWKKDRKARALIIRHEHEDIIFVKPQTFMNSSGISVSYLMNYYDLGLDDLLVVHDDVDLDFLQTKLQKGAGPAGHKGVEDIVVSVKSKDFWRFRVGVGRPHSAQMTTEDFILATFSKQELKEIKNISLPISG